MSSDIHGQKNLARSVATNWAAQIVQIVSGFVIPRLVDNKLGTEALGSWDLAWSIVTYFNLITIGSTSSINRFVAFHRSRGDMTTINHGISSIGMIMRGMGIVIVAVSGIAALTVGHSLDGKLGTRTSDVQLLVLILGLDVAVQVSSSVFASVLTGCHRWDIHNAIQAATNAVMLGGMATSLMLGGGIVSLAVVHLASESIGRATRAYFAFRVCPTLEIRFAHYRWIQAKELLKFGGKTFLADMSQLVLGASVNLLIATHLGPAALAVYARPFSLNRNFGVFINKFAMVYSPMISSLRGAGQIAEAVKITLQAARFGVHLVLPVSIILITHGNEIMHVWMGQNYAEAHIVAIISIGFCFQMTNVPLIKALIGFNLHGTPGAVMLATSVLAAAACQIALNHYSAGTQTIAIIIAATMTFTNVVFIPAYASRKLGVKYIAFWRGTWLEALVANLPFAVLLAGSRWASDHGHVQAAVALAVSAPLPLAVAYWRNLATDGMRRQFRRFLRIAWRN